MLYTLNVGSGKTPYKFYPSNYECTNIDIDLDAPGLDLVCDTRSLPPEWNEHFDYILASDIIEHFTIKELPQILKEWNRVLKIEGRLEIRTPNLENICKNYLAGSTDLGKTSWLIYGAQNYKTNFHKVIFDPEGLENFVESFGFLPINRHIGSGSNMIITFVKTGE